MTNVYSLADYRLIISQNGRDLFSIGGYGQNGAGSFVNQVTVRQTNDTWTTDSDATGSWVHNKNMSRTGTVALQIRQVSDDVLTLLYFYNLYFNDSSDNNPYDLTICKDADIVAKAESCFITKAPDRDFQATAQNMEFSWTCGKITNIGTDNRPANLRI